jgi:UDP-N-acetylmuramyl pentapeptide phosphotransferase/UDP-N-acetylglucosamine-1-phosphate transferase
MSPEALLAAFTAFAIVVVVTPGLCWTAGRFGLLDTPNPRSSHRRATPRGGGLAIVVATFVALMLVGNMPQAPEQRVVLAVGLTLAGLGLADDRLSLPALPRLAAQVALVSVVVAVIGGLPRLPLPPPLDLPLGWLGYPLAVLWVVAVLNFYNFLDGIDGIAALQGAATGFGIAWLSGSSLGGTLGAGVAGACLGFLIYNWAPARIFLGDVGSVFLGYTFAVLPLLAPEASRGSAVLFVALSLWLFLADATWTLLRRVARGLPFYEAHREHLYQRLVASGWSHRRVSCLIGAGSGLLTVAAGIAVASARPPAAWLTLALAAGLFLAEARLVRQNEGARGATA